MYKPPVRDTPFGRKQNREEVTTYSPVPRVQEAPAPLLSRAAYEAAAPKAAGYVAPSKRGPEVGTFDDAFPSLNKIVEAAPVAKKSAWSSSSIKAALTVSAVVAPTDRKAEIAAAMATAEAAAVIDVAAGRKPRCVVIDISDRADDMPAESFGILPNMNRYYEIRAERLRKEEAFRKAERRRVFDYSSEESAESVPEDNLEEMYPSDEEGADGEHGPVAEAGDEYEFRR